MNTESDKLYRTILDYSKIQYYTRLHLIMIYNSKVYPTLLNLTGQCYVILTI